MKRLRRPAAFALLFLAGCAGTPSVPPESDWKVTSVQDLLVEIVGRTQVPILWAEDLRLGEKLAAFPRAGPLWNHPEALLAALKQVLWAHELVLIRIGERSVFKIVPPIRC